MKSSSMRYFLLPAPPVPATPGRVPSGCVAAILASVIAVPLAPPVDAAFLMSPLMQRSKYFLRFSGVL